MELINAASSPETQMNGNFQTLEWAQVYGRRVPVTTGLTWGYYGGVLWGGFTVADGTLTLTNTAANYIVVNKTTGAISVSTAATNWNDTAAYARVYKVTTAAGVVSTVEDHRAGAGGLFGGGGGGGGGGAAEVSDTLPTGLTQGEQWFESDTGGLYMRYVNPDLTETLIAFTPAASASLPSPIPIACGDETTALTTGVAKVTFRMPNAMTLTKVKGSLTTASTSGIVTVDLKKNGTSIFSTLMTFDVNEKTTATAAVPSVLATTALADDDEITIDITGAGTGAKGLKVYLV